MEFSFSEGQRLWGDGGDRKLQTVCHNERSCTLNDTNDNSWKKSFTLVLIKISNMSYAIQICVNSMKISKILNFRCFRKK